MNLLAGLRSDGPSRTHFVRIARDIALVGGAVGLAQILAFTAAPLLTRLYSPDIFGRFALFNAAATIFCPLATLRFEWALPLPLHSEPASDLLFLCTVSILASSLTLVIVLVFASPSIAGWTRLSAWEVLLFPGALAAFSFNATVAGWLVRERGFSAVARVRFATILGVVGLQVVLGSLGFGVIGLISGSIGGYLLGAIVGGRRYCNGLPRTIRVGRIWRVATEYRSFPVVTAPSNVINGIGAQLPSLALPSIYGLPLAGQYALAQRVLAQPTAIVCQAANQVYWGNAAQLFAHEADRLWPIFARLNLVLLVAASPGLLLTFVGPEIFSFVFGADWAEAGRFAGIMFVGSFFGLAAQSTTSLHIYRLNHWMGAWEVLQLILVATVLAVAVFLEFTAIECIVALTAAAATANIALLILNGIAVRHASRRGTERPGVSRVVTERTQ
jgi:O-antigen/teichoic acid export membrane protein